MRRKHPLIFGVAIGFAVAVLQMPFGDAYPTITGILNAPAYGVFQLWHGLGLPPQGEAALAGPFFAMFVQWFVLGLAFGFWLRHKNRQSVKKNDVA